MIEDPNQILYTDPEEDEADWQPPAPVHPDDLPDNTDDWHVFYRCYGRAPKRSWPVALGRTREISPPWRRGFGVSLTRGAGRVTYGIWVRGSGPSAEVEPHKTNLQKTLRRARKYGNLKNP